MLTKIGNVTAFLAGIMPQPTHVITNREFLNYLVSKNTSSELNAADVARVWCVRTS